MAALITVVGIDPGLTGAVAAVYPTGSSPCRVHDIPTVPVDWGGLVKRRVEGRDLALLLRQLQPADSAMAVYVELVQVMGGKNNAAQTQGSLMRTLGAIEAALDILRIKPVMVTPQSWKQHYGLRRKKDETDSAWKGRSLALARQLFPDADLRLASAHNKAEALLIAHYGATQL